MKDSQNGGRRPSASLVAGAIALVFLIIGYQAAVFIHKASVARIISNHDSPDTVFVTTATEAAEDAGTQARRAHAGAETASGRANPSTGSFSVNTGPERHPKAYSRKTDSLVVVDRKSSGHSTQAEAIRRSFTPRRYESFPFDPNTVSIDDLMRLGFSLKQAQSIDSYRSKGGRFRRKADFARSYVVEDSVYQRLEKYIEIPKIDLNAADSAQFQSLPGIGKFFAAKMSEYREELGGYSFPEQLMEIWHFDREKYEALKDLVTIGHSYPPYPLWTLPEDKLSKHPYIGKQAAHGIVLFRENSPQSEWKVENLVKAGILGNEAGSRLARCRLESPQAAQ